MSFGMPSLPDSALPADVATLQAMLLAEREMRLSEHRQRLAAEASMTALSTELGDRDTEIAHLKLLLAKLRRMQFGRSSEKLDAEIEQLELALEELLTPSLAAVKAQRAQPASVPVTPRRELPAHLPREDQLWTLGPNCADCGHVLRTIGEDISEQLEYVPARFKVIRHIRPKLACPDCQTIVQHDAPSRPIVRGQAGPGLLAQVIVAKFCDHLPLYRQSQIYARNSVELDRAQLADWMGHCAALLAPLVERIAAHTFAADVVHGDDTTIPVLAPGRGKTVTARLWTYVRDGRPAADPTPPAVLFRYSPDRKGEHPQQHLAHFRGILQADGYAGFGHL